MCCHWLAVTFLSLCSRVMFGSVCVEVQLPDSVRLSEFLCLALLIPQVGQSSPVWSCCGFTDLTRRCLKIFWFWLCGLEGLAFPGNMLIIFISRKKCPGYFLSVSSKNSVQWLCLTLFLLVISGFKSKLCIKFLLNKWRFNGLMYFTGSGCVNRKRHWPGWPWHPDGFCFCSQVVKRVGFVPSGCIN